MSGRVRNVITVKGSEDAMRKFNEYFYSLIQEDKNEQIIGRVLAEKTKKESVYTFDTLSEMPLNIFQSISKQFPSLKIEGFYAENNLGKNCGTWFNSKGVVYMSKDGNRSDSIDFAKSIWNKKTKKAIASIKIDSKINKIYNTKPKSFEELYAKRRFMDEIEDNVKNSLDSQKYNLLKLKSKVDSVKNMPFGFKKIFAMWKYRQLPLDYKEAKRMYSEAVHTYKGIVSSNKRIYQNDVEKVQFQALRSKFEQVKKERGFDLTQLHTTYADKAKTIDANKILERGAKSLSKAGPSL